MHPSDGVTSRSARSVASMTTVVNHPWPRHLRGRATGWFGSARQSVNGVCERQVGPDQLTDDVGFGRSGEQEALSE